MKSFNITLEGPQISIASSSFPGEDMSMTDWKYDICISIPDDLYTNRTTTDEEWVT
jgi:hypothetical protein